MSPVSDLRLALISSPLRNTGLGKTDIYYSRLGRASWSPASLLRVVSTPAIETASVLSPDDQALFFLRRHDGRERMYWVRVDSVLKNQP